MERYTALGNNGTLRSFGFSASIFKACLVTFDESVSVGHQVLLVYEAKVLLQDNVRACCRHHIG